MSFNNDNQNRRSSNNLNLLFSILNAYYEGKIKNEDIRLHLSENIRIFFSEKTKDDILTLKRSVEELFSEVHSELVSIVDTKFNQEKSKQIETRYMTINEVCRDLNITKPTFYNWEKRGLRTIKNGGRKFVSKSDLDNFLESN
jgi:excisionase family DNA binding protein